MKDLSKYGMKVPEILLPKKVDLSRWSVIACDQWTQDRDYWKKAAEIAGSEPSTLNIIFPEVYLGDDGRKERIAKIQNTMKEYLADGVFGSPVNSFIYIERTSTYGRKRNGLVVAIDLDTYEWKPFSKALIRATEATIVDRIPPRKEIRKGAPLESPHIMLLVNDRDGLLVEKTGSLSKGAVPVYDGELMLNGGHITGWTVSSQEAVDNVASSLEKLYQLNLQADGSSFLFAVGDGNHSLATAKAVWDECREEMRKAGKSEEEIRQCPVKYALVEIVNIYDQGLTFEPIHRVMFGCDPENLLGEVAAKLEGSVDDAADAQSLEKSVASSSNSFGFVWNKNGKPVYRLLRTEITELAVSRLQPVLDDYMKAKSDSKIEIDYIHGSGEVFRLGNTDGAVSILLPPVAKDSFFATIGSRGPLPRKSFSMGEADEKRYYLECRKLFS